MTYKTTISCEQLDQLLGNPDLVVIDCRSKQSEAEHGERAYHVSHIEGAVYGNLDRDMAAPHVPGQTGRHPLPEPGVFVDTVSRWGVDGSKQVVVYDDMSGAYAARLWWMLRWMGHDAVAVLDGGWQKWIEEEKPTTSVVPSPTPSNFVSAPRPEMLADVQHVDRIRSDEAFRLFDARSAERFRGENETLDPVGGHIPGALSFPYTDNLDADGLFKAKEDLRARFEGVGEVPSDNTVSYCGSGVTAAHNILAMVHAGYEEPRLYVGSWSHWITDPSRPTK